MQDKLQELHVDTVPLRDDDGNDDDGNDEVVALKTAV